MNWIESAIEKLLVKSEGELNSRLQEVGFNLKIADTKAVGYCHCLKLDGNGMPRMKDLVEFIGDKIVDYSIPKKELDEAKNYLIKNGSTSKILNLKKKAARLFTEIEKTGEGGEMMLYILVQEYLRVPQLISKMSLKTSGNVHYHGVDGIHVKYDPIDDSLILFWGESKMYKDINQAIKECLDSLKGFILDTFSYNSTQERDLQLITANINQNVNDEDLENLLVRYFDKDDDLSNKVKYQGGCFIGFDYDSYPKVPLSKKLDEIKDEMSKELNSWLTNMSSKIKLHNNLRLYEIHVFLMPLPSVKEFREHFLKVIKS